MIVNNLLKPISVKGSSEKVRTDTVIILRRKKAENTWWDDPDAGEEGKKSPAMTLKQLLVRDW